MARIMITCVLLSFTGLSFASAEGNGMLKGALKITAADNIKMIPGDVEEGIEFFHGSWSEALKKSKKEDKLIFLDAMAAWCGPCKMMAAKTFTDKEVGEFFNKNFINFKMDMEKHDEGPRLSKKFGLRAYPSLYLLDENEEIIQHTLGYQDAKSLIEFGESGLE